MLEEYLHSLTELITMVHYAQFFQLADDISHLLVDINVRLLDLQQLLVLEMIF